MKKRPSSIHKRICLTFIAFFTVLMICIVGVIQFIYRELTQEHLLQARNYEDTLVSEQLKLILENTINCSNRVILEVNNSLSTAKQKEPYPNIYDSAVKKKILTVINNNMLRFPFINQISILYNNGDLYRKDRMRSYMQSQGNDLLKNTFDKMDITTKGQWYYSLRANTSLSQFGLHYVKLLRDISTNQSVGYVVVEIDETILHQTYRSSNTSPYLQYYICDANGMMVTCDDRPFLSELKQRSSYSNQLNYSSNYLKNIQKLNESSEYVMQTKNINDTWFLYSVYNQTDAMSGINKTTYLLVIIAIIVMAVFYVIIVQLSKRIASPIINLSKHMTRNQTSLPEKLPVMDQPEEIGILIDSFNQMIDQNRMLFERVKEEKKQKRQLELSLLQAQIKPHFLYNTLDTIYCLSSIGRVEEASAVTKSLAEYYRLVLNKGQEWINLEQELEALKNYLEIQAVRYRDVLEYKISIPKEMGGFQIPKLTLQPLVENSIYHGIKPKNQKGHLLITGDYDENWVYIRVIDDGVGMTKQTFDKILSGEIVETMSEGFGLKNVSDRIRLFYGSDSKIELEDNPIGTTIVLCLNLQNGGEL